MNQLAIRRLFTKRRNQAAKHQPGFKAILHFGPAEEFPNLRDYAYCGYDDERERAEITFGPRVFGAPKARVDALIRHELAHGLLMARDLEHTERECDAVAERVFGDKVYYDADDIQTLDAREAVHDVRPSHLPD